MLRLLTLSRTWMKVNRMKRIENFILMAMLLPLTVLYLFKDWRWTERASGWILDRMKTRI